MTKTKTKVKENQKIFSEFIKLLVDSEKFFKKLSSDCLVSE